MARPSKFTQKLADDICGLIADGESLRKICDREGMPDKATVLRWLADEKNHKEFCDQYVRAREAQADKLAEEILEIADDGANDTYTDENGNERTNQEVVARSRLRVDARKWLAAKMAPKKYGEKIQQEVSGPNGGPIVTKNAKDMTDDELAAIAGRGGAGTADPS